jgi:hypothetical protein
MTRRRPLLLLALLALVSLPTPPARAAGVPPGFTVEVLVGGRPAREYAAEGARFIEAIKGQDYAIRLHNPLGVRVAVALAVDGLNTIDARHTSPLEARKWVLEPYETVTISGWQTNLHEARKFYFTSEERSYASRLGQPDNIGIISAVFFRERAARVIPLGATEPGRDKQQPSGAPAPTQRNEAAAPPPAAAPSSAGASARADEYAGTGIGDRTRHLVQQVHLDLERDPTASVDIRYEYRAQLVRLGILPDQADPLDRRQRARGFSSFCPDIK